MKKRNKTMISLLVILVVLLLLYFIIGKMQKNSKDEVAEKTTYATEAKDVVSIKYSDGTKEMSFVKNDDVWQYEADGAIALDQSLMESMVSSFSSIKAEKEITKPDALSDYGLEESAYTIELTDTSGKTTSIYIGNDVDGSYYYLTVDEKTVVYTASSSVVDAMKFDIEALKEVEETEEEKTSEETTEAE